MVFLYFVPINIKSSYTAFLSLQRLFSGADIVDNQTVLQDEYDNGIKTQLYLVECFGHALNYIVYVMLLIGATKLKYYCLVPFIAHCIVGISLCLGGFEAFFFLGLKNRKLMLFALISLIVLVVECMFLTYSRKLYLEIKDKKASEENEQIEKELIINKT